MPRKSKKRNVDPADATSAAQGGANVPAARGGDTTRCGFVAIVGAPNVGKSTLVNRLVGTKVSIVSPKVQTTRFRIVGIVNRGPSQVLLVDTPGLFAPKRTFEHALVSAAWRGIADADRVVLMVDSIKGDDAACTQVVAWLKERNRPAVLVLNKTDAVAKPPLLALASALAATGVFAATFMVSAQTGDGVADLMGHLADDLPLGPWLFPADDLTDMPNARLAAEITREQIYWQLHEELPYAVAVETEAWEARPNGDVRIDQIIYVERAGQRAIVLGHGGERIRSIGERSRRHLEELLGCRVHLFLHVRLWKAWRENRAFLARQNMDVK